MTGDRIEDRGEGPGLDASQDARFVAFLRRAAASYHVPPETPTEAMWTAIEAGWRPALGASGYHRPPETPKEEMWARIEAAWRLRATAPPEGREAGWEVLSVGGEPPALDGETGSDTVSGEPAAPAEPSAETRDRRGRAAWVWPVGIAATLALGILIGRETIPAPGSGPGPVASDVTSEPVATMEMDTDTDAEARGERAGEEGGSSIETPSQDPREPRLAVVPLNPGATAERGATPIEDRRTEALAERSAGLSTTRRTAADRHLARVETFLTAFRAGEADGADDVSTSRWAEELLAQTRLLLDWSDADPRLSTLLEELELVLVQIVRLDGGPEEREWVVDAMERRNVLPRLRSAVPAGPAPSMAGT